MKKLFRLLYRLRVWLVFFVLSATALWLSTQKVAPALFVRDWLQSKVGSFHPSEPVSRHAQLAAENAQLRERLMAYQKLLSSSQLPKLSYTLSPQYRCVPAVVVGCFTSGLQTYITLDKGREQGIESGMGVINDRGVVGRVRTVSKHFCTVASLLHTAMHVSSIVGESRSMGTVRWRGDDTQCVDMLYVPRHLTVHTGDAVVTSGYNATFPAGIPIGRVEQATLHSGTPFYDIRVCLAADFSTLHHVYVVRNHLNHEQTGLEETTKKLHA